MYVNKNILGFRHFDRIRRRQLSQSFDIYKGPDKIIENSLETQDGLKVCKDFVSLTHTWLTKSKVMDSLRMMKEWNGITWVMK
ncbi:unnamed protein product [Lactuca saligna]|uniref:Uncharacterized protein n=1 Tax=Lactuca saligna TaxID=75948 RepID=A0AA35YZL1_LACSI|nr:unnamed protein product [Lactuca saligna]